jgi:hypothetical protein
VAKKDTDILLIRKYLNGELDARAMHQLEARAQDDPFLMDALEGYEKAGSDQQSALAGLSSRLQQRVEQKQVRSIIPFRALAIAASVLVVFTIGWLVLVKNKPAKNQQIAVNIAPLAKTKQAAPVATDTVAATRLAKQAPQVIPNNAVLKPAGAAATSVGRGVPDAAVAPVVADDKITPREVAVTKAPTNSVVQFGRAVPGAPTAKDSKSALANIIVGKTDTADTTPLNELVVMNYNTDKKKEVFKDTQENSSRGYVGNVTPRPTSRMEQQLISKAEGVSKTPGLSPLSPAGSLKIYVQGRIIDEIDGQPLPGVSVKATGGSYGAVTDRNGRFYVPSDSLKHGLVVSRLGYNTTKIGASKGDSLKTISLAPSDFPLKEAPITNNVKDPASAHPLVGWNKYNKYLGDSAISPDGKTGTVSLFFWVDKGGFITGVAVQTSLSDAANKKAIDLVNKGPKWVGNANGRAEQVTLTINF